MKNFTLLSFISFLLLGVSVSCDKVENPVEANSTDYNTSLFPGNYVSDYPYPTFSPRNSPNRVILLEDYTGHKCGNCPEAATVAKDIEDNSNGSVVVLSVHAGQGGVSNFQKWNKESDPDYPKYNRNFTNEDGLAYAIEIDGGCPANPTGMVSRLPYGASNSLWLGYSTWQQATNALTIANEVIVDLQLEVNFYSETNGLFVHAFADTKQDVADSYSIIYTLVDKEIIDWQKNYDLVNADVEDYSHHNVHLRNLNGTYGQEIFPANTVSGETYRGDATFTLSENEVDSDLAVVAFVMNNSTYEVVQVAKADVAL